MVACVFTRQPVSDVRPVPHVVAEDCKSQQLLRMLTVRLKRTTQTSNMINMRLPNMIIRRP